MCVSLALEPFANNALIVCTEAGNIKTKGLNMYVIRRALTHTIRFFGNEVSNVKQID